MQKAWFYEEYGPKEVRKLGNLPIPSPLHNQLLVQFHAADLNPIYSKRSFRPISPSKFPAFSFMSKTKDTKNGDFFPIWNYAYGDIIETTEDFNIKYCIGIGGYGNVYKAKLHSGR
ncbi:unnamed protein product [Trifolium pratense]|uniref:Uncharacterized protein n=1 Tax=Trifolium pratense TaxID=57577 RepID=A0ACB0KM49_TRIPR|nr:unnamed protein product [Trifolium pratense]